MIKFIKQLFKKEQTKQFYIPRNNDEYNHRVFKYLLEHPYEDFLVGIGGCEAIMPMPRNIDFREAINKTDEQIKLEKSFRPVWGREVDLKNVGNG